MQLSILVVSRSPELLSQLLASLDQACSLPSTDVEVLCSWNGTASDETAIVNASRYGLRLAQRDPYHFASNINGLIQQAAGSLLMLVNDDVWLDAACIDAGLRLLTSSAQIGLVGALLRSTDNRLIHLGIGFDHEGNAYHVLDGKLTPQQSDRVASTPVAAVTGALQWLRRSDVLPLNTHYRVCGEDVELCLDLQQRLGKQVWLCREATAVHQGETTRRQLEGQQAAPEDQARLRQRWAEFLATAPATALAPLLKQQQWESHMLRVLAVDAQQAQATQLEMLEQRFQDELHAMESAQQRALEVLEQEHADQCMALRDALKAERSLQLQQARQSTRLLDDLQADRLRLKAQLEHSRLPAGPRETQP